MSDKKSTKKPPKARIRLAVASSTAIETGESIAVIKAKLKSGKSKYKHLTLAS